jgi:hypothetical protein
METVFLQGLDKILCAGYMLAVSCINLNLYLISAFYQKKFNQVSPRAGFMISIAFSVLYVASFFFSDQVTASGWSHLRLVRFFFLTGGAAASAWSSASLFITMRKPRK